MKRPLFEAHYHETYSFANIIRNVLHDQFEYLCPLNEFYGAGKIVAHFKPFPKFSALHSFIEFIATSIIFDDINTLGLDVMQDEFDRSIQRTWVNIEGDPCKLPIEIAMSYHKIEHTPFHVWLSGISKDFLSASDSDVYDYYCELQVEQSFENLMEIITTEVFYILFQNRGLLMVFNNMMASIVTSVDGNDIPPELQHLVTAKGVLRRANIPSWVRRAVFYRDRGFCTNCHIDLSGTLSIGNLSQFDHIVPLAAGGLNDVTNIQLLCQDCNQAKRAGEASTSNLYEAWYPS